MTRAEKDGRCRSYARGWHDGATHTTAPIGTPEPRYPDEYERGEREGRCAHAAAMKARRGALNSEDLDDEFDMDEFNRLNGHIEQHEANIKRLENNWRGETMPADVKATIAHEEKVIAKLYEQRDALTKEDLGCKWYPEEGGIA